MVLRDIDLTNTVVSFYWEAPVIPSRFFPKYDAQQDIYPKIIQELTEASALSATGTIETADVLYTGNIDKWKNLAIRFY
jgi:hypothetical protein